ncbi:four helix bundle protein [Ereboglobus sp. PH5-10]|uniref:four helix bundle protein n=1 Tax=Ereboglobus sp. PH5-10 TaxID=2940629 RepID=UPI002404F5F8|nr:four helix bundle protein [Ereboglobus sp. PH5-10]MDF9825984.1 four helix bundle protein [Ereboglobus sp. PH5-10]
MTENELKQRTKKFALRVLKVVDSLPNTHSGRVIANQLGRSGTSVGANYRAVCRSRSSAEMISKLSVVEEEADESGFWLEITAEHGVMPSKKLAPLQKEAGELVAIMVASRKTLLRKPKSAR